MYFLIHKFSDWLNVNGIHHILQSTDDETVITIKNMNDKLYELLSNISVSIDTGKEINDRAVRELCSLFDGNNIIIKHDAIGESLNVLYPIFKDYIIESYE